jgi:carbamoyltransferase
MSVKDVGRSARSFMKDGYYLSTYLSPPGIPRLVNVWPRHDLNVSLWSKSGSALTLEAHWELERISGRKQHGAATVTAHATRDVISTLLSSHDLRLDDVNEIWGTPGIDTSADYGWAPPHLPFHSISHLFSAVMQDSDAFYGGKILGLAVDGIPDWIIDRAPFWYAGAYIDGGQPTYFPVESPGRIYDSARELYGRRAGTLMALATASEAAIPHRLTSWQRPYRFWGGVASHHSPFEDAVHAGRALVDDVTAAVARASAAGEITADARFSSADNSISAAMKVLQALCLRVMERNIDRAISTFSIRPEETYLALAGGFALNCPANSHLMERYGFKGFLAPPCVNDSGQAIGIGLATFFERSDEQLRFSYPGAYLGQGPGTVDDLSPLHRQRVRSETALDHDQVVRDIIDGPIAWVDGRAEVGPRALGHRSLLADPRSLPARDRLNELKGREWWRPVAPIILADAVDDWVESADSSPYMLRTFELRSEKLDLVPAIAHLDRSARIQTVAREDDPVLYALIDAFRRETGIPILCNTSLNDKGEPIINSGDEAFNFCIRKGLETLYLSGKRLVIDTAVENYERGAGPYPRNGKPFWGLAPGEIEDARRELNPHNLDDTSLIALLEYPWLRRQHRIQDEKDAKRARTALVEFAAAQPREWQRLTSLLATTQEMYGPPT